MPDQLYFSIKNDQMTVVFSGHYVHVQATQILNELLQKIRHKKIQKITFDTHHLYRWDSTLSIVLMKIMRAADAQQVSVQTQTLPSDLQQVLKLISIHQKSIPTGSEKKDLWVESIGSWGLNVWSSFIKGYRFIGKVGHSFKRFVSHRLMMRPVDFLLALDEAGPQSVGIVALISFMVGLILAFVGAIQLRSFGAQIYVASLVSIGMTRIMGAIMVGIIVAGRTGSSYAATLGTMRVNEELDALKTMGIAVSDFLVFPRLMALFITVPILTILADFMGMIGGGCVGTLMLGIPLEEYIRYSVDAFTLKNFLVGLFHGLVFGGVIALCGCYYGLHCGRNADSVGKATTRSVVSAIIWMIVLTGLITVLLEVFHI